MREVSYFAPASVGEAAKLLAEYGARATILAGGTDLLPQINHYEIKPEVLVFIGGLGLNYIREADGTLAIGAATPTAKLATDASVAKWAGAVNRRPIRAVLVPGNDRGHGRCRTASHAARRASPPRPAAPSR